MSARIKITQAIIVDKALELAEKQGIEQVTIANIARALNIKSPSIYNHVNGLDEIKQLMAVKAQKLLFLQLKEAVINKAEGAEKLKAFAFAYCSFATSNPGIYEASIVAPDSSLAITFPADDEIINLIKQSLAIYNLNVKDSIHIIRGLRSLLHGLVDLDRKGGFKLQVDLHESLDKILDTFLLGLSKVE